MNDEPQAPQEEKPETTSETTPEVSTESTTSSDAAPAAPEAPAPVAEPAAPAPQPVVVGSKKSKAPWIILLLVIVLAAVGYVIYHNHQNKTAVVAVTVKHDVPLIKVDTAYVADDEIYPNIPQDDSIINDQNDQIFEGLTGFGGNGTKVVPELATSWTNPDINTWVFTLRQGVKFHDGNTMTAKQVAASINQFLPTDPGQIWGVNIASVTAVDDHTVKITTSTPDSLLPSQLTFLKVYDTDDTAHPNDPRNGTGPYTIKPGTTSTDKELQLVAVSNYWGGHVYVKDLDYLAQAEASDVVKDMNNGAVQVGGPLNGLASKLNSNSKAIIIPNSYVDELVPNNVNGGPVSKVKVRQAIALALDPVALAKAHGDIGTPISQIVPQLIPGYNPALKTITTNIAEAKSLVTQAGYPDGLSFKFTYFSPADDQLAATIKQELAPAGINVVLDPETQVSQLQAIAGAGKTDMYFISLGSDFLDGADIMSNFVESSMYSNTQLNTLYDQANKTLDPAKRLALLQQMSTVLYNDKGSIPLYVAQDSFAFTNKYNLNITYNQLSGDPGINFWQAYSTK